MHIAPDYFVSYHEYPAWTSATSGTCSEAAFSMQSRKSAQTASCSAAGASTISSSCTCKMSLARNPCSPSRLCTAFIAILMMSAAAPCTGVFMAARSPNWRRL